MRFYFSLKKKCMHPDVQYMTKKVVNESKYYIFGFMLTLHTFKLPVFKDRDCHHSTDLALLNQRIKVVHCFHYRLFQGSETLPTHSWFSPPLNPALLCAEQSSRARAFRGCSRPQLSSSVWSTWRHAEPPKSLLSLNRSSQKSLTRFIRRESFKLKFKMIKFVFRSLPE